MKLIHQIFLLTAEMTEFFHFQVSIALIQNTDLNPLMVKETQEVKWCKVNALFSVEYDFVAGRSVMEKCLNTKHILTYGNSGPKQAQKL